MAKVTITFTEDEVLKMKALTKDYTEETVELCGWEPAFLEAGIITEGQEDYPNDIDLFVNVLGDNDKWEKHFVGSIDKDDLTAGAEYQIFRDLVS